MDHAYQILFSPPNVILLWGKLFIVDAVSAIVYNIVLGVGGGIDIDFKERAGE